MSAMQMRGEFMRGLGQLECWWADAGNAQAIEGAIGWARSGSVYPHYAVEIVGEILDEANQPVLIMGILHVWDSYSKQFIRASSATAGRLLQNRWHDRDGLGLLISRGGAIWRLERVDVRTNRQLEIETTVVWLRFLKGR